MTVVDTRGRVRRERLAATPLYLVASLPVDAGDALLARVAEAAHALQAAAGAVAVQLRVKDGGSEQRRELLRRARGRLPDAALLLVNDDLQAARAADGSVLADGVHLGREDAAALAEALAAGPEGDVRDPRQAVAEGLRAARAVLGTDLLLGTSVRTQAELADALAAGADHVGFGAIAASTSKADTRPADVDELRRCLAAHPHVPVFPIGGLSPGNLPLVAAAGARRAAVGAAILQAPDPAAAALACLRALRVARA